MPNATWLADVLRAAGLKVEERPGWKTRGRATMGPVRGIIAHHTASAAGRNAPSVGIVEVGRLGLAGPLAHVVLARDGTWIIIAAGRCNHAGAGNWQGVTDANGQMIGVEAENTGTGSEPWSDVLIDSYARGCAAILMHIGAQANMLGGHKEYALPKGRKIDPNFDMLAFRLKVAHIMAGAPTPLPVDPVDITRDMLRLGDRGDDVRTLQRALGMTGDQVDGSFGPKTKAAVEAFQRKRGLTPVDGIVGPKTWDALL